MTKFFIFFVANLICLTNRPFAQSITFDYSNANLNTNCNVFASATSFQGYSHQTSFGFPYFSSSDGAIILQSKPISSSNQGSTQYAITYPFKQGYTYAIALYGKSTLGSTSSSLPSAAITLSNSNGGVNTSTSCTGPQSMSSTFDISYGHMAFTTAWSWSPNLFNGIASQNFSYLLIAAVPASGSYTNDQSVSLTYIRKIQIIETPPAVSFNITPADVPITCGTTSPITFTVNNPGSVTGITNYTWNLGATPNGWKLPNGSAAPATYSTSTNTLTLTPVCGSVQKNISATVTANGNNYNTNASTVSVTLPTMSINGSGSICSGSGNYSVTGLPCNATVAWSITPASGVANLSCSNCTTTSLSYVDNGVVTLTATVSNVCSQQIVKTKTVAIGHATTTCSEIGAGSGSCIQNNFVCPSQLNYWQYAYIPFPGSWGPSGTGYHLEVHGGGYFSNGLTTQDVTSNYFSAWIPGGGGYITVSGMNNCGVSQYTPYVINYIPKSGCSSFYNVSPNPATSSITVRTNTSASSGINKLAEERLIDRISIYNEQGTLVKDKKISKMQTATVNISGLFPGKYVVEIASGTYKESQIIIVQ